jgi:hypothetical protein
LRIILISVGQGVGGGRAERRVTDTVTYRKQFLVKNIIATQFITFYFFIENAT